MWRQKNICFPGGAIGGNRYSRLKAACATIERKQQTGAIEAIEILKLSGTLIGGLGLFLLAIAMMTDGLQLAAGPSLRKLLSSWSSTPLKGIFSGMFMTAVVQSSSAVTVASLGFVNAGLISVRQALGIVYGANVGTTMTGWLVVLVGFKFNIQALALPMIGIGMLLRLFKTVGRLPSIGLALAGFGLFFLGIDILKNAFEGLVETFDLSALQSDGISGLVTSFFIGVMLTVLTQSSSASIALTITAAASGMLGLDPAAAMVIGANVGTTSTAAFAAIGATSNARRVAAAQVIFNVSTALVAFLILPILFFLTGYIERILGLQAQVGVTLALFHTIFNVLGILLIYPFNDRLAAFLEHRFLSWEEKESHPKYIDSAVAKTPVLAVNALLLEMRAIAERIVRVSEKVFDVAGPDQHSTLNEIRVVKILSEKSSRFIAELESNTLTEETVEHLATLMRIDQYYIACVTAAERIIEIGTTGELATSVEVEAQLKPFSGQAADFMRTLLDDNSLTQQAGEAAYDVLHNHYETLKSGLILSATRSKIGIRQMSEAVEFLAEVMHCAKQWKKAMLRLHGLTQSLDPDHITEPEPGTDQVSAV